MDSEKISKSQAGTTLMETLVALSIFLVLTGAVWLFIKQTYAVQTFTLGQVMAISEAQRGVETLIKEVREAMPGDTGAYALEKADDFEFIFYADYDRDNAVEKVRYFLSGTDFIKGITEPTGSPLIYNDDDEQREIISRYVRNEDNQPVFQYFDGNYSGKESDRPLNVPAEVLSVKIVHVYLKINVIPNQAPNDFHLESDAQIRNLKINL